MPRAPLGTWGHLQRKGWGYHLCASIAALSLETSRLREACPELAPSLYWEHIKGLPSFQHACSGGELCLVSGNQAVVADHQVWNWAGLGRRPFLVGGRWGELLAPVLRRTVATR